MHDIIIVASIDLSKKHQDDLSLKILCRTVDPFDTPHARYSSFSSWKFGNCYEFRFEGERKLQDDSLECEQWSFVLQINCFKQLLIIHIISNMSSKLVQLLSHPTELKSVIQLKTLYPLEITSESERKCYDLLKKTSRSFAAVIMELNPELRNAIMLFYLVLRALDTVEDDMTIDPETKVPLLRTFDSKLLTKDWTFDGNGPNEKDRIVLVEFDQILTEYHKLKPQYQDVIKDITHKMGNGMADYINDKEFNLNGVATVKDYDFSFIDQGYVLE
ncbi:unnamed protein product [Ambrosiozyma monospora]|uniref:Unnamed protein product n=1 Tax=Ambrosiozyma monospora TaxID=43982 RepID=A0ACB5TRW6_AMBMO|nr:unnamed protein product [Ambrosiozyma monospora]